jgi:hypothetical protein
MVIATAATTQVIASATDEKGLVNQAFKLTIIIGLALAIGTGIFLIWKLTSIFSSISDSFLGLSTLGSIISNVPGPLGWIATVGTWTISAFGFGNR